MPCGKSTSCADARPELHISFASNLTGSAHGTAILRVPLSNAQSPGERPTSSPIESQHHPDGNHLEAMCCWHKVWLMPQQAAMRMTLSIDSYCSSAWPHLKLRSCITRNAFLRQRPQSGGSPGHLQHGATRDDELNVCSHTAQPTHVHNGGPLAMMNPLKLFDKYSRSLSS